MDYGTLENGKLSIAPNPLFTNGTMVFNPPAEDYERNGYLPVIRTPYPADGNYCESTWKTIDGQIVRVWSEAEPPIIEEQATETDYLAALERFGVT